MDLKVLQNQFISRVETASGKPVLVQSNSSFAGHATIRLATKEQPASVLLYKPELEAVLPYLVAFQCELALRTLLAEPQCQFNLVDKPNMQHEVLALVAKHLEHRKDINDAEINLLASRFGNGLGFQLRSMPVAMRVDQLVHANHLRPARTQKINNEERGFFSREKFSQISGENLFPVRFDTEEHIALGTNRSDLGASPFTGCIDKKISVGSPRRFSALANKPVLLGSPFRPSIRPRNLSKDLAVVSPSQIST